MFFSFVLYVRTWTTVCTSPVGAFVPHASGAPIRTAFDRGHPTPLPSVLTRPGASQGPIFGLGVRQEAVLGLRAGGTHYLYLVHASVFGITDTPAR
jgi:hypothetical protein